MEWRLGSSVRVKLDTGQKGKGWGREIFIQESLA